LYKREPPLLNEAFNLREPRKLNESPYSREPSDWNESLLQNSTTGNERVKYQGENQMNRTSHVT